MCAGRRSGSAAGRAPEEFANTVTRLLALAEWLKGYGVTHVAMEAAGMYWLLVWHILGNDFELTLGDARHVKNVWEALISIFCRASGRFCRP